MHVVIIGPCSSGLLYFGAAKEMGMTTSAITITSDEYALPEHVRKDVDNLIIVKDFDIDIVVGAACRLNKDQPIDAIVAGDEFLMEQTAHVAYVLGLPFITLDNVAAVRDKSVMRQRLHDANIRAPRFVKADNAVDLEQLAKTITFPAVIKPLQMASSVGVVRVDNMIELLAGYEDIANDHEAYYGLQPGVAVIVEEFLVGTAYDVDGYVTADGEITAFEFVQVNHGPQPHFQEIGYTVYRPEDLECATELSDYIKDVVRAVGITIGPFHGQVMMTDEGPALIEIANRLPGDHIPLLSERATGISFPRHVLAAVTSTQMPEPATPKARVAASQFIIEPQLTGKQYKRLDGWDEIIGDACVDGATIEIQPGEMIPPHVDGRSRLALIEFHGDSVAEVEAFRKKILENVHVSP